MKLRYIFTLLFISINIISFAQSKSEKAVAAAAEELRLAMISGDRTTLEKIVDDSLSYGHSSGHIDNKAEFVEKLVSGTSDFVSIDITSQHIYVSGTTAIVRHRLNAATNDNGKPGTVELDVMLVFQKHHGKWTLLARQAVKVQH